jgi:cyclopropane fatty-acyl-phospholipid synthase-like methyltransferase
MKPFSEACERNQQPILSIIKPLLKDKKSLLEIGSGTGQHAVYFAEQLPHINWQTSDQKENHKGIQSWIDDSAINNVISPISLDVTDSNWPCEKVDAVFSANTAHIMSWEMVKCFFEGVGQVLNNNGLFMLYGPFNYNGNFTSESNQGFEQWLKSIDVESGIRDFEAVNLLAEQFGMALFNDYDMPSNNRILVWSKLS